MMNSTEKEELNLELARHKKAIAKEQVDLYFKEVIHPYLPNCNYQNFTDSLHNGIHLGFGASVGLRPFNNQLKQSSYYYDKSLEFIHYTSLKNCINILREKSFRIYSLSGMDDSFELKYASQKIFKGITREQIQSWKNNIYSLSMCELDVETQNVSLDQWRNYGDDGYGIGIVLSIDKENQETWYNRYLSQIYYGSDEIKEIVGKHTEFLNKQKAFHILGDHQELLLNLCCFHKPPIYKSEKEVRYLEYDKCSSCNSVNELNLQHILTGNDFPLIVDIYDKVAWKKSQDNSNHIVFDTESELDISKSMKPVKFKRLPLSSEFKNNLVEKIECPYLKENQEHFFPKIKIKKFILGYRYKPSEIKSIESVLNELSESNLGYNIKLDSTRLKEYF